MDYSEDINDIYNSLSVKKVLGTNTDTDLNTEISITEWTIVGSFIREMDIKYDASFFSWIKSEKNIHVAAPHIKRIVKDYSTCQIIRGLRWLISEWSIMGIANLFKGIFIFTCCLNDVSSISLWRQGIAIMEHLTQSWAYQHIALLLSDLLLTQTKNEADKFAFLVQFMKSWSFEKVSGVLLFFENPGHGHDDASMSNEMKQQQHKYRKNTCVSLDLKLAILKKFATSPLQSKEIVQKRRQHRNLTGSNACKPLLNPFKITKNK